MIGGRRRRVLLFLCVAATVAVRPARPAQARGAGLVPYPIGEVWPATIRFLRVDHDYPVKEKDESAGYILFEIVESKRAYRAALELVKTSDGEGRAATQLFCTVSDLPRRYEATLLDKLTAKIRDERGPPAPPPARKPPLAGGEPEPPPPPKDDKPPPDINSLPRAPTWGPSEK
jgi:hypothetical protein